MENVVIGIVSSDDDSVEKVQKLGDTNRATLGFFPSGAFSDAARKGNIIGAFYQNVLVGYLLYRYSSRRNIVTLVHVCIDQSYRSQKLADRLINSLVTIKNTARWFEADCRRDYNLDLFWQRNGFFPVGERPGRAEAGSTLTMWRRENGEYNFFSIIDEVERKEKIIAILDTCIILDLFKRDNEESQALLMDGINNEVAYRITPQCKYEINQNKMGSERKDLFTYTSRYELLGVTNKQACIRLQEELKSLFDPYEKNTKDIIHLSESILGRADVFVTRDDWIYSLKSQIYERYGLSIVYPGELISQIDELVDEALYSPTQIAGSNLSIRKMKAQDLDDVTELYNHTKHTSKRAFTDTIRKFLAKGNEYACYLVMKGNDIASVYVVHTSPNVIQIPCLLMNTKNVKRAFANTLVRHILNRIINNSKHELIYMPIDSIKDEYADALHDLGFLRTEEGFVKILIAGMVTLRDLKLRLKSIQCSHSQYIDLQTIESIEKLISSGQAYLLEQLLWPVTIIDIDLPTYIVPINPHYAIDLFDDELRCAHPTFLPVVREDVALSIENVYFTSAVKREIVFPSRVLWYTTQDSHYVGTGALRSLATVLFSASDSTSEMYRLFRRFGVLTWKTINELGKGQPKKVQAIKFGYVRHAPHPLTYSSLKEIIHNNMGKEVMLQSAYKITAMAFQEIYQRMFIE